MMTKSNKCGLFRHISFVQYRSCPSLSSAPCAPAVEVPLLCARLAEGG